MDLGYLPPSLTHLTYFRFEVSPVEPVHFDHLPPITHLWISMFPPGPLDNLPRTLIVLSARWVATVRDIQQYEVRLDHLPPALQQLKIDHRTSSTNFPTSYDYLPPSLTHLSVTLNGYADHLPLTITHLEFGANLNVDYLPTAVTHLCFGHEFDQPLDNLPSSVTHLFIASMWPFPPMFQNRKKRMVGKKSYCFLH